MIDDYGLERAGEREALHRPVSRADAGDAGARGLQQFGDGLRGGFVILNQQDRHRGDRPGSRLLRRAGRARQRQFEPERRALSELARHADVAAEQVDQLPGDGEAQTGPAVLARLEGVDLREGLEDVLDLLLGDAETGVLHGDAQTEPALFLAGDDGVNRDVALLGVLDGVAEQVGQDLPEAKRVAVAPGRHLPIHVAHQLEATLLRPRRQQVADLLDEIDDGEVLAGDLQTARLDLREVQDVVDDLQQRVCGGAHRVQHLQLSAVELRVLEQFRHPHDTVHRRADLVAHAGEEVALGPAGMLRLLRGALEVARPLDDQFLQLLPVLGEVLVAAPDLAQHVVEADDEAADLVGTVGLDAEAVVLFLGDAFHRLEQALYGPADRLAQAPGYRDGDEQRDAERRRLHQQHRSEGVHDRRPRHRQLQQADLLIVDLERQRDVDAGQQHRGQASRRTVFGRRFMARQDGAAHPDDPRRIRGGGCRGQVDDGPCSVGIVERCRGGCRIPVGERGPLELSAQTRAVVDVDVDGREQPPGEHGRQDGHADQLAHSARERPRWTPDDLHVHSIRFVVIGCSSRKPTRRPLAIPRRPTGTRDNRIRRPPV